MGDRVCTFRHLTVRVGWADPGGGQQLRPAIGCSSGSAGRRHGCWRCRCCSAATGPLGRWWRPAARVPRPVAATARQQRRMSAACLFTPITNPASPWSNKRGLSALQSKYSWRTAHGVSGAVPQGDARVGIALAQPLQRQARTAPRSRPRWPERYKAARSTSATRSTGLARRHRARWTPWQNPMPAARAGHRAQHQRATQCPARSHCPPGRPGARARALATHSANGQVAVAVSVHHQKERAGFAHRAGGGQRQAVGSVLRHHGVAQCQLCLLGRPRRAGAG